MWEAEENRDGWFAWTLAKFKIVPRYLAAIMLNDIIGIMFTIFGVGAETVCALARRMDLVRFVGFHHPFDLTQKYFFKLSRKLHHYLQRKPFRQLHLKKGFMITIDMEVSGSSISEDFEELPTNWTAVL
jgi:hypothetical protein